MTFFPPLIFFSLLFLCFFLSAKSDEKQSNASTVDGSSRREILSGKCNIFSGKWVYDSSYPLYRYLTCPFIDPQFNCLKYGRPDNAYTKYRWQPSSCDLPRFNGRYFLEQWRGKKIMFVGDSLSTNQWQSLACMIQASVPKTKYTLYSAKGFSSVTFKEYGVMLMLYRTPYLVDLENEKEGRVLKLDSIKHGKAWRDMDMLIFNTWHWWTHTEHDQPWDYIEEGGKRYKDMNRMIAYYKGLTTWARWVNRFIDSKKTKVFFQAPSPTHYEDWNEPLKTCRGQTQLYTGYKYPATTAETVAANAVVNKVFSRLKKPVYLLDVTGLSQYRKDGHPSAYSGGHSGINDCSHWCLPGLPDTWNQLLYSALFT